MGEKQGSETYRLHFKRRHTVECTNLIIIRTSDLLLKVKKEFFNLNESDCSCRSVETLMVHPECLQLIGSLLSTNQIALLIDFADPKVTDWMYQVLLNDLKVQVDAIYSYNNLYKPSILLLDVTQIINDFRLYSDFQQSYKKTLADASLFTFIELSLYGALPTQLLYNGSP